MTIRSISKPLCLGLGLLLASPLMAADKPAPKPIPALISSKAARSLLLGVANAGPYTIAVGGNGVILRSTDGVRWTQVPCPVDSALNQVAFADAQQGWAVGHDGVILHTADGGQTWVLQNFQPDVFAPLFAVLPIDSQQVLAVGAFGTLKQTLDGGAHWADVEAPEISGDKYHLNTITRLRDGRLLVAGERGLVGLSTDGKQWTRIPTPYEGSLFGALPVGEHGVLVFGMRGNVFYAETAESGQWQKLEANTTASLFGGAATGAGSAVLVGADGLLLQVEPQARTVKPLHVDQLDTDQVFAAVQPGQDMLVVAGDKGVSRILLRR